MLMTTELHLLVYSVILGIIHLVAASHFISHQYGYRWTAGNREEQMPPLKGVAGRVDRATTNFLETFPFFAAVILTAHVVGCHGALTIWGAHLYFWGRIFYTAASMAGFPLLRSLSWNIPTTGILLFVIALLK
jgi:uncharacterized MAPEG superfamily protein